MHADWQNVRLAKRKVTAVILFLDYSTGDSINSKDVSVTIVGSNIKPVYKEGGYCVFVDLQKGEYDLLVSSAIYINKNVHITVEGTCWKGPKDSIPVFLNASCNYPLKVGSTFFTGKLLPNMTVVATPDKSLFTMELKDAIKGIIVVNTIDEKTMINRQVALKLTDQLECFTILEKEDGKNSNYQLCNWNNTHRGYEAGSILYPASIGQCDSEGRLLMPIWGLHPDVKFVNIYLPEINILYVIEAIYGQGNHIRQFGKERLR